MHPVTVDRLASAARDQLLVLYQLPTPTPEDAVSVQREVGWIECLEHFAARGELSHAGRVEAEKLIAASRDWVRELMGDPGPER